MWDFLVLLLVVSPFEPPASRQAPESLWQALRRVSFVLEIVGPHEHWRNDFHDELRYVRQHWRELADAPPWTDTLRLPPSSTATKYCSWNLAYQEYADGRRWMCRHRWDEYTVCLEEARQLYQIWKSVQEATDMSNNWVHQRRALRELRDLLGPDSYAAGWLPPPAPVWRFDLLEER